jgi:ribose transport system permease protein
MIRQSGVKTFLARRWTLLFLVLELVVFSVVGQGFLSLNGIQIVLYYGTTLLLLATAETFVIVSNGIDLSAGYMMGFATVVSAKLVSFFAEHTGMPDLDAIILGVLLTLLIAVIPGMVSGALVGRLKVPSFLATFSTGVMVYGIALILIGQVAAKDVPILASDIGNSYVLYWVRGMGLFFFSKPALPPGTDFIELLPTMVVVTAVFVIAGAFILKRTRFGRHVYAIGGNVDSAVRAGINIKRNYLAIYTISSVLSALAGIIYMLEYITGKADAGVSFLLYSITCVVIGGASLNGGIGTVWGSVLGVVILQVLQTGLGMSNVQTHQVYIAVGVVLIFAVLMDKFFPELTHKED